MFNHQNFGVCCEIKDRAGKGGGGEVMVEEG